MDLDPKAQQQEHAGALRQSVVQEQAMEMSILVQPKVSCVMLVCGRLEMTAHAIRSLESQTYEPKELCRLSNNGEQSIGLLRNRANAMATGEILCHFDTDDISHPNRITEQVALLQSSGADVVGYREMLFWRSTGHLIEEDFLTDERRVTETGEAWLYHHDTSPLGSSLCYWRTYWEKHPFADAPKGESTSEYFRFVHDAKCEAVSSTITRVDRGSHVDVTPRMVCRIHAGNTSSSYQGIERSQNWKRVPEWDEYARRVFA
jgi:Glycosyl transferase family 2